MSATSSIEWTDATWNPVRGCTRVSEGCRHCYAESVAYRFSGPGLAYEGLVRIDSKGVRRPNWNGKIQFVEEHLLDPMKWKPAKQTKYEFVDGHPRMTHTRSRRIFVNSMSDLFHENVTDEMRDKIFAVMALCPQHTFQVLTKRPERMLDYLTGVDMMRRNEMWRWQVAADEIIDNCAAVEDHPWPLPNVWLGVSVENQDAADERIPLLLQTPAAVRFISAEPLLGEICIERIPRRNGYYTNDGTPLFWHPLAQGLDWVIVGGESGPGSRYCHIRWIRNIVEQCVSANVPVFVKQLGSNPVVNTEPDTPLLGSLDLLDKKGGDISEFPRDLQIREFPEVV